MDQIVREFAIRRRHVELPAEFLAFEVDVVETHDRQRACRKTFGANPHLREDDVDLGQHDAVMMSLLVLTAAGHELVIEQAPIDSVAPTVDQIARAAAVTVIKRLERLIFLVDVARIGIKRKAVLQGKGRQLLAAAGGARYEPMAIAIAAMMAMKTRPKRKKPSESAARQTYFIEASTVIRSYLVYGLTELTPFDRHSFEMTAPMSRYVMLR
mgnify:CR=1 FL=1